MPNLIRISGEGFSPFYALELTSFWQKLLGLLPKRSSEACGAVLLDGCASIHTFGMAFSIDCCFLDALGRAVAVNRALPPGRMVRSRGAVAVIEQPSSQGTWIQKGAHVVLERGGQ